MVKSKLSIMLLAGLIVGGGGVFYATHAVQQDQKTPDPSEDSASTVEMRAIQEFYKQYDGKVAERSKAFQEVLAPIAKSIEELNQPIEQACKGQETLSLSCKEALAKQAEKQVELFKTMEAFYGNARKTMEEKKAAVASNGVSLFIKDLLSAVRRLASNGANR